MIAISLEGTQTWFIEIIYANPTQQNNEQAWTFKFTVYGGIDRPWNTESIKNIRSLLENYKRLFMFVSQQVHPVPCLPQP